MSRWLQTEPHAGSSLTDFSTLKMEAIRSFETSVHTRSTRRHVPEDGILQSHCRENLKSYLYLVLELLLYKGQREVHETRIHVICLLCIDGLAVSYHDGFNSVFISFMDRFLS
jgi:hypothetical protein